ncbi:hypothetical protein D3C72_1058510 [compost metagenome]
MGGDREEVRRHHDEQGRQLQAHGVPAAPGVEALAQRGPRGLERREAEPQRARLADAHAGRQLGGEVPEGVFAQGDRQARHRRGLGRGDVQAIGGRERQPQPLRGRGGIGLLALDANDRSGHGVSPLDWRARVLYPGGGCRMSKRATWQQDKMERPGTPLYDEVNRACSELANRSMSWWPKTAPMP